MDLPILAHREIIDVTCGVLFAKLHKERFICPGINRECIEFQGQFITPKSFYLIAEKGSLKDWKNAIRINGKKIRVYIESGELDFYNHNELCTGRCKSRLGPKSSVMSTDLLSSSPASSSSTSSLLKYTPTMLLGRSQARSGEASDSLNISADSISEILDSFGEAKDIKPSMDQLNHMMMLDLKPDEKKDENEPDTDPTLQGIQLAQFGDGIKDESDEDVMFWRAIVQLGLVDEFFREIKSKLDVLKVSMIKNNVPIIDAKKASSIVNELGMRSKLDLKLCAHKYEFDRQRQKLEKEMDQLKRKVVEYEQKKEVLKRKSDCYEALMTKKFKEDSEVAITQYTVESASGQVLMVHGAGDGDAETTETSEELDDGTAVEADPTNGQALRLNGEAVGDADANESLLKGKTAADLEYTIETASGKVLVGNEDMPTLTPTLSPTPSTNSQDVASRGDTPELEFSELSSQASSVVA